MDTSSDTDTYTYLETDGDMPPTVEKAALSVVLNDIESM
jgi:hypothetical protein